MAPDSRSHRMVRPLWLCRVCAGPWPCGPARLALLREFGGDRCGLSIQMATLYVSALHDLSRLHPYDEPTPELLFQRFVGWVRQ